MLYKEEIEKRLEGVNYEHRVAFAARAALRSLPLLAVPENKGEILEPGQMGNVFWYWEKTERSKHLLSIMKAQCVGIALSCKRVCLI